MKTTTFKILFENTGGKLDESTAVIEDANDEGLAQAVSAFVLGIGMLRDGDIIRIVEVEK